MKFEKYWELCFEECLYLFFLSKGIFIVFGVDIGLYELMLLWRFLNFDVSSRFVFNVVVDLKNWRIVGWFDDMCVCCREK